MFGELVCGPPGSGKTTYCEGKRQFLSVYDPLRPVTMLNLDPANEGVFPYPCDIDIRELVSHASVMREEQLGPNGSYLFCAAVMERNVSWIVDKLVGALERRMQEVVVNHSPAASASTAGVAGAPAVRAPYVIIDCPGQVEFYINSTFMHTLFRVMEKRLQCSLCTVHLVDAGIATRDLPTYVSAALLSVTTMIDHELPHLNVLTKWDLLSPGELADVEEGRPFLSSSSTFLSEDFDRLWRRQLRQRRREQRMAQYHVTDRVHAPQLDPQDRAEDAALEVVDLEKQGGRLYTFTKSLMEVIDGYGMLSYVPLDVQSQEMMLHLTQEIDNAVGNLV